MQRTPIEAGSWILLGLAAVGCAGGTNLDDPEHVRNWANSASALAVFAVAHEPVAFADGEMTFDDATCPTTTDDGTTVTITGGCTDAGGEKWVGTATLERGEGGAIDLTLDGYGHASGDDDPVPTSGTFSIRERADGSHSFDADYETDGLTKTIVEGYSGEVVGGYEGVTTWSGHGTVTRGGFATGAGTATVTTVDEVRDPDACTNQAASGTTTIEIDDHTLVIEYDGATDCDDDSTAQYTVDGEDRGSITGVSCAVSPGRSGGGLALLALLGVVALAWRRARRRG